MLLTLSFLLCSSAFAGPNLREANDQERELLLSRLSSEGLKAFGISYAIESEIRTAESKLIEMFEERGSISDQAARGYIQHLADRGLTEKEITERIATVMKTYFYGQQMKDGGNEKNAQMIGAQLTSARDAQSYAPQELPAPQLEEIEFYVPEDFDVDTAKSAKGGIQEIWIAWGYNRDWHSRSDAMFKTMYGDFTIHDAYGDDVPKKFGIYYFDPEKISIPQYNIEIGVMFNDKWGIDLKMDHMKWKFDRLRDYEITGDFSKKVWSTRGPRKTFEQAKADKDASWLRFEHTDGYNYISVGVIRNFNLVDTKVVDVDARVSAGAGAMVPRTDVRLYYQKDDGNSDRYGINNKFHVAGYGAHADARLKITFWDRIFLQATARGSRIKIKNALVDGAGASLEHTPINSLQIIGQIGYQHKFNLKSKSEKKREEIKNRRD